eukprot:293016-Hanusia_phi.AAC.1
MRQRNCAKCKMISLKTDSDSVPRREANHCPAARCPGIFFNGESEPPKKVDSGRQLELALNPGNRLIKLAWESPAL